VLFYALTGAKTGRCVLQRATAQSKISQASVHMKIKRTQIKSTINNLIIITTQITSTMNSSNE
jgi:hypothetical protein